MRNTGEPFFLLREYAMSTDPTQLKQPKTYEEQLDILRNRGLVINDETQAIAALKRVNYYRLTAYTLTFKKDNVFHPGTTFEKLYRHYDFDSKLRNLLSEIIEYVEIAFRSHLCYEIAHKYGALGYQDPSHFRNKDYHDVFLKKLNDSLKESKDHFVIHHREKYNNQFPVWVAFEVLTFSNLSMLFKNLLLVDQRHITKSYYRNLDYDQISNWLHGLTIVRNRCAHYSRLFNHKLPLRIGFRATDRKREISSNELFAVIFNTKYLIEKATWQNWVIRLEALVGEYHEVDIRYLGFKEDWHALLTT
jgi:abortive infection bacteriophage resistance protein